MDIALEEILRYKNEDVILNDENITDLRFDVLEVKKKLFDRER